MVPVKKSIRRRVFVVLAIAVVLFGFAFFALREDQAQAGSDPSSQMTEMEQRLEKRRKEREESKKRREALFEKRAKEIEQERAEAKREYEREREEGLARLKAAREEQKKQKKKARKRVRRFSWEEAANARGRIWNIPRKETEGSLLTAFLRVCMAEASGKTQDCVGIWQVVNGNRRRQCVEARGIVRRITECDEETGEETMLSSFRRHQRHVMGYMEKRNRRAVWISNLETDCEMPDGWLHSQDRWDAEYGARVCPQIVADGRHLIKGELPPPRPGHRAKWIPGRPIAWGGRCESNKGACDDPNACVQGYARIKSDTLNAFWCRVGRPGCRKDPDPVCAVLGKMPQYKHVLNSDGSPLTMEDLAKRLPGKHRKKVL